MARTMITCSGLGRDQFTDSTFWGATGRTRPVRFEPRRRALVGYDQWHPKSGKVFPACSPVATSCRSPGKSLFPVSVRAVARSSGYNLPFRSPRSAGGPLPSDSPTVPNFDEAPFAERRVHARPTPLALLVSLATCSLPGLALQAQQPPPPTTAPPPRPRRRRRPPTDPIERIKEEGLKHRKSWRP